MSAFSTIIVTAIIAVSLIFAGSAYARRGPSEGTPIKFKDLESIGNVLERAKGAGQTVHVVYVHGMRADEWNAARYFLEALEESRYLEDLERHVSHRQRLWEPADHPQSVIEYAGSPLIDPSEWATAWERSIPFVVRTTFQSGSTTFKVVVDEVNYWPLLMGLRCRALVGPDSQLAGAGSEQAEICMRNVDIKSGDPYYPWLKPDEIKPPALGKGAAANRWLKHTIINWGFADAVISLGPMRHYLRMAMDLAAKRATDARADERILIAESLGSFVAMDAAQERGGTRKLVRESRHFYFLANQFALLQMARVRGLPSSPEFVESKLPSIETSASVKRATPSVQEQTEDSPPSPLEVLKEAGMDAKGPAKLHGEAPAQVVAVSDPSDVLTFLIPEIEGIEVSNVQARFSGDPLNLLAHPLHAHRGGIDGPRRIWKHLLEKHPR